LYDRCCIAPIEHGTKDAIAATRWTPRLTLTTDMKLVLGLVVLTMVMFLFERIRADVVALVVLVVLGLTGLVRARGPVRRLRRQRGDEHHRDDDPRRRAGSHWRAQSTRGLVVAARATACERGCCSTPVRSQASTVRSCRTRAVHVAVPAGGVAACRRAPASPCRGCCCPLAAAIVMGGALTMVGNSPLILLNDLLVAANANLPSGAVLALAAQHVSRRCRSASRWRHRWRDLHFSLAASCCASHGGDAASPRRARKATSPSAYGIDGDVHELTVTRRQPAGRNERWAKPSRCTARRWCWRLQIQQRRRASRHRPMRGSGSADVLGAMGPREAAGHGLRARTTSCG
jgi:hypothetical protein